MGLGLGLEFGLTSPLWAFPLSFIVVAGMQHRRRGVQSQCFSDPSLWFTRVIVR